MAQTIYATFTTEQDAERAAGALMDHGAAPIDISFLVPERLDSAQTSLSGASIRPAPTVGAPVTTSPPPLPTDGVPLPPDTGWTRIAQNIFGDGPTANEAKRMDGSVQPGYTYDAMGAVIPDRPLLKRRVPRNPTVDEVRLTEWRDDSAFNPPSVMTDIASGPSSVIAQHSGSSRTTIASDLPIDVVNADHGHILDNQRRVPGAASGITLSTGRDAARGAAEGAGIGAGLGLALGLATVFIPGVGLVAGANALLIGLTAAMTAAGGLTGGVFGSLTDLGVPPHIARNLDDHIQSGMPLLSIHVSDALPQREIILLLEKYGATAAEAF